MHGQQNIKFRECSCNFTVWGIAKCLGDPLALLVIMVLLGRDDVKAHFKPLNLAVFCPQL